jgi:hypothetical protein
MLAELVGIGSDLEKATDLTNGMRVALSRALGYKDGSRDIKQEESRTGGESLFSIEVKLPDQSD